MYWIYGILDFLIWGISRGSNRLIVIIESIGHRIIKEVFTFTFLCNYWFLPSQSLCLHCQVFWTTHAVDLIQNIFNCSIIVNAFLINLGIHRCRFQIYTIEMGTLMPVFIFKSMSVTSFTLLIEKLNIIVSTRGFNWQKYLNKIVSTNGFNSLAKCIEFVVTKL